jgi:hypothetical protein
MMGVTEDSSGRRPSGFGGEEELEVEEQEPLLRRPSTMGPQQFEEERQEAARQAALEAGWFTWLLALVALCLFSFWLYVNFRSWYILLTYYNAPCDQPLSDWLLAKLLLDGVSSSMQQRQRGEQPRPITWFILGLQNAWLVLGFHWCGECKTCETTCPELYNWCRFLVLFGVIVALFLMLLPVLFYMVIILVVHLSGAGLIKNNRAARSDTLELVKKVEYSPHLFADGTDPNDERPAGECCCCCEVFNAEKPIVETPCGHYFHKECLGEWLKLAKTCPICRSDLDLATEDLSLAKDVDNAISASGALEEGTRVSIEEPSASSGSGTRHYMDAGA